VVVALVGAARRARDRLAGEWRALDLGLVIERLAARSLIGLDQRRGRAERVADFLRATELARAERVADLREAEALRDRDSRLAVVAALGRDDDNAVRGLAAVQRRGRGALEHLDGLDVVRVDIGDAVDRVVLR